MTDTELPPTTVGRFSPEQIAQLLKPIAPSRVAKDGKGKEHVTQQDIVAHLIRIFGFGSYDLEVVDQRMLFESPRLNDNGKETGRWDVCYKSIVKLIVRDLDGVEVCHFEDGSTGDAQNTTRADAHDLAMKASISLAKKRCAINLGDQFGLSLYNKGQMQALVRGTIADPNRRPAEDVQAGVAQQSLSDDEGGDTVAIETTPSAPPALTSVARDWLAEIAACTSITETNELFKAIRAAGALDNAAKAAITERSAAIRQQKAS